MVSKSVSGLAAFAECHDGPFFIGVDVHKKSYSVGIRDAGGNHHTWVAPADPRALVSTLLDLGTPIERIAYEAGPTGFVLARTLADAGLPCWVARAESDPPTRDDRGQDRPAGLP